MPIIDVELVCHSEAEFGVVSIDALANALGNALGTVPGRTWVRMRYLGSNAFAENQVSAAAIASQGLPVFVTVLVTRPPEMRALTAEIETITAIVATCVGRSPERVHVQYAPAAAGRQAFGGRLVV